MREAKERWESPGFVDCNLPVGTGKSIALPKKKEWPCEHVEIHDGKFMILHDDNTNHLVYVPSSWDICPAKGCGARRPAEKHSTPYELLCEVRNSFMNQSRMDDQRVVNICNCVLRELVKRESEIHNLNSDLSKIVEQIQGADRMSLPQAITALNTITDIIRASEKRRGK